MTMQGQLITWESALKNNDYSYYEFNKRFKIQIWKYLRDGKLPREKTCLKIEDAMKKILTDKRIPYHPAYGYATPEQIAQLSNMGLCPERDLLLKKIAQQNEAQGKVYQ